jgi:hypothetical protein
MSITRSCRRSRCTTLTSLLSNFEVRSDFAKQTGVAIAKVFDKNISRSIIQASRAAADGPFPAGAGAITDAALLRSGASVDGLAWLDAIRKGKLILRDSPNFVPEELPLQAAVSLTTFDAILNSRLPNGQYVFGDSVRMASAPDSIQLAGCGDFLQPEPADGE